MMIWEYRIITDGNKFRPQRRVPFLKWHGIQSSDIAGRFMFEDSEIEVDTIDEARRIIEDCRLRQKGLPGEEWKPVE